MKAARYFNSKHSNPDYKNTIALFQKFAEVHGLEIKRIPFHNPLYENLTLDLGYPGSGAKLGDTLPVKSVWTVRNLVKPDKLSIGTSSLKLIEIINEITKEEQNIKRIAEIKDAGIQSMFLFLLKNSKFFNSAENKALKKICLALAEQNFKEPSDEKLKPIYQKYVAKALNESLPQKELDKKEEIQIIERKEAEKKSAEKEKTCQAIDRPTIAQKKIPTPEQISAILQKYGLTVDSLYDEWLNKIEKNPKETSQDLIKKIIYDYFPKEEALLIESYSPRFVSDIKKFVSYVLADHKYPKTGRYDEEIKKAAKLLFKDIFVWPSNTYQALKFIKLLQKDQKIVSSSDNISFQIKSAEVESIVEKYESNLENLYLTFLSSDKNAKWTINSIQNYTKKLSPGDIKESKEKESDAKILYDFLNIEGKNYKEMERFKDSLKAVAQKVLLSNYIIDAEDFKKEFKECLKDSIKKLEKSEYFPSYPPQDGEAFAVIRFFSKQNEFYQDLTITSLATQTELDLLGMEKALGEL